MKKNNDIFIEFQNQNLLEVKFNFETNSGKDISSNKALIELKKNVK